jgi:RNA polymerase sigma-70 factor (ECF subfamily)
MVEPTTARANDEPSLTDLMIRYQAGELQAFDELYRRTLPMIRGYLRAVLRDTSRLSDLIQETYLQLHRSRATYDPVLPLRPWLLGIVRYVRLRDRRAITRRHAHGFVGADGLEDVAVPPEVAGLADRDALERAMSRLPDDWREAVVLHHIYGMSFREIGLVAGVSEGGARIRASRGMSKLRRVLTTGKAHE